MLERELFDFLDRQLKPGSPLLLGLSGGPDSLALFHLLLAYKKKRPFPLVAAHLDHGWRPEGRKEEEGVRSLCGEAGVPLHFKRLASEGGLGNREDAARRERFAFFSRVAAEVGAQALLLGHHADDLAETVLKRLLEGADWSCLKGMTKISSLEGLCIWRPLLRVSKKEILAWLQERGLSFFRDETNEDEAFLRARMRRKILPALSGSFGKEVSASLLEVASNLESLESYFDERLSPLLQLEKTPFGHLLDLSQASSLHPVEVRYLLRKASLQLGLVPTREQLASATSLIEEGRANRWPMLGGRCVYLDRRRLFFGASLKEALPEGRILLSDRKKLGGWRVSLSEPDGEATGWKAALKGRCFARLAPGEYSLGRAESRMLYPGSSPISSWWGKHKIPAYLWSRVPVVYREGRIAHEFLTGRCLLPGPLPLSLVYSCSD